ncbi:MAG: hypothetical protein HOM58_03950 [Rhodospirillaceae bacterium]|jgi:hypothetical protein|nr:hypothetical protein [Rhodospirillaceae bacterium]MBT5458278.1 hypothetical protein [Rhodospirillaceae bacterium]
MGTIEISVDSDAGASIFDVRGEVTADEIIAAMDQQYVAGAPPHAIWDYSRAGFFQLITNDYKRVALAAKERSQHRPGGKTAFVAPGETEAIALRFLQATSQVIDLPIPLEIHQTRVEALAWLKGT